MAMVLHEVQHGHGADGRQARGEVPEVREPVGVCDEEAGEAVLMTELKPCPFCDAREARLSAATCTSLKFSNG